MPELLKIRDRIVGDELEMFAGRKTLPTSMQPLDAGFYTLPGNLLSEYEQYRQKSELGRLFKAVNALQAKVDRVVVLGIGGSYMGARALMESCAQPYWNELSRGERGSKPRMYFEGNNVDNDATQSLLQLLSRDGQSVDPSASKWGLVVISKSGGTLETAAAFRIFLAALEKKLGSKEEIKDYLIPITGDGGNLHKMAQSLGVEEFFPVPDGVGGRFSVLSAVGLVPAALLGINVIELLQGAVAMNNHFASADADNIVLQQVAVNHLLQEKRGVNIRVTSVWSKALESLGLWYDQLSAKSLGKQGKGFTPVTTLNTRDLHSRHQQHQEGTRDKVFNNIIVEEYRCDPAIIGNRGTDFDSLNEIADKSLPAIMSAAIEGTNQALADDHRPYTNLYMPKVDELHMGQIMQMLMIATVVEGRLMGINPYGQPGVEGYKKNMNLLLGRS